MISKTEQAIIDNDIDRIVEKAMNPPKEEFAKSTTKIGSYIFDEKAKMDELSAYILKQADNKQFSKIKPILESGYGFGYICGTIIAEMQESNLTKEDLLRLTHYMVLLMCIYDQENKD